MTFAQMLVALEEAGVRLSQEGEQLRVRAPKGALTAELRQALQSHKQELLVRLGGEVPVASDGLRPRSLHGPQPLSHAQEQLWFLAKLAPDSPYYNVPTALRIRGALDVSALARSLQQIVKRHAALRTVFREELGRPMQVVLDDVGFQVRHEDFRATPDAQKEERIQAFAAEEARAPFDLAAGPLIRATLLQSEEDAYVLLVTMHHIISDGWSVSVVIEELAAFYEAAVTSGDAQLPELSLDYRDFSLWQRETLGAGRLEALTAHWRERLTDAPRDHAIPADRRAGMTPAWEGGVAELSLGPELTERLQAFSRERGASLFMTLLAAYGVVLGRQGGREDMVVGTAIAGRTRRELEPLVGYFVNGLAIRLRPERDLPFERFLAQVQQTALDAYAHQDLPFERLVQEMGVERESDRNPLFETFFALQNTKKRARLHGLDVSIFRRATVTAKFDLYLSTEETADGLLATLEYRAAQFERTTAKRLLAQFRRVLEAAVSEPTTPVSRLPLMDEAERDLLVSRWNPTAPAPAGTIDQAFREQARRTPGAVAVAAGQRQLTYSELERRSNQLARFLRERGVTPESLVGLSIERGLELPVALLGVLKAGGAYVPLDRDYPRTRLERMAADARPSLVLTVGGADLPGVDAPVVDLDRERASIDRLSDAPFESGCGGENAAYVCFTSGSSGRPKGAVVAHCSVMRLVRETDFAPFTPEQTWLQLSPVAFDASTLELWAPLLNGGRLVMAPPETPSLDDIADAIERQGVDSMWLTAGLFHLLADERPAALQRLRLLLAGGDTLSPAHVIKTLENAPGLTLVNGYGPTENTTFTCCHRMTLTSKIEGAVPIGKPIPGTTVCILDEAMQPAPIGVAGELFTGGSGLARGYAGRPSLTAEKFVPNPFDPGGRLYRTGDRARWLDSGVIEFLGRVDDQLKIRGFRIEPREIEATLSSHPAIESCVVAATDGRAEERQLVAYFKPAEQAADDDESLAEEHVGEWRSLYEDAYGDSAAQDDPTFNIVGWNSSYDGEPIGAEAMREWVEQTVRRISALGARRTLEIGCGTGLLLFRLARDAERYVGLDFSAEALDYVDRTRRKVGGFDHVELSRRTADDLSGFEEDSFDLIVLNSIVQYFPSVEYLLGVLREAARVVRPGGHIFVGDVRSLPLLEAYHASIEVERGGGGTDPGVFAQRLRQRILQERELVLDPALFAQLAHEDARLRFALAQPKRGREENELTRFRYDVTLSLSGDERPVSPDWRDGERVGHDDILGLLGAGADDVLAIRGLPNARLVRDAYVCSWAHGEGDERTVAALRDRLQDHAGGLSPEKLAASAEALGYHATLRLSPDKPFHFDAVFSRKPVLLESSAGRQRRPRELANDPLSQKHAREVGEALRRFAAERLPDYMTPSAFVAVSAMPLTANGKVDRKLLPALDRDSLRADFEAARNEAEEKLAAIWRQVLGLERVGVHDNFFELGGDSILSIQIVARANVAGLSLTPKMLFERQTIAELAEVAGSAVRRKAEQGLVQGEAPLSPIARWFFARGLSRPQHFNQSVLLDVASDVEEERLREAWRRISLHHDALRLRTPVMDGSRVQRYSAGDEPPPFQVIDVRDETEMRRQIASLQQSFDLVEGPTSAMALLSVTDSGHRRLFWSIHHLAVDGVSWRILVEDLERLCVDPRASLPEKTSSYAEWAREMAAFAPSEQALEQLPFWLRQGEGDPVPTDHESSHLTAAAEPVHRSLSPEETTGLLDRAHETSIEAALLAPFLAVLANWSGARNLRLDLEGHGREELADGLDVSRTVGWFTALYPLTFDLERIRESDVDAQLRTVPMGGAGYGALRYLGPPEVREQLAEQASAPVSFNYLGRFDQALSADSALRLTTESTDPNVDPQAPLAHLIEVNALVRDGRLEIRWDYAAALFDRATVERLAEQFVDRLARQDEDFGLNGDELAGLEALAQAAMGGDSLA